MQNRFYVYALQNPRTGIPFYVGKGTGNRLRNHFCTSYIKDNTHKWHKLQKLLRNGADKDAIPVKLADNLYESEAYELEAFVIEEIGLDNLTNIVEGGSVAPRQEGEENHNAKLTNQEAAWIHYLTAESDFGGMKLYNHYKDYFSKEVNRGHFTKIKIGRSWQHIEPEKPPFWDEEFEFKLLRYFSAIKIWRTTDNTAKEAAAMSNVSEKQVYSVWHNDLFGLKTKLLNKIPEAETLVVNNNSDIERRYQAIKKWRTTDIAAKEAAKEYGFTYKQITGAWHKDSFGLKTKFFEEHPSYND